MEFDATEVGGAEEVSVAHYGKAELQRLEGLGAKGAKEVFVSSGNSALERRLVETFAALKLPRSRASAEEDDSSATETSEAKLSRPPELSEEEEKKKEKEEKEEEDEKGEGPSFTREERGTSASSFIRDRLETSSAEEEAVGSVTLQSSPSQSSPQSRESEGESGSTDCTSSSGVPEASPLTPPPPPPFGEWRLYSLADVKDEQMSASAMQRAADLLMQQRREAKASLSSSNRSEDQDPRMHIGPRRIPR